MTAIGVTGATGTMGTAVLETAADRENVDVSVAVDRGADGERVAGREIHDAADLPTLLADRPTDVVVDFTGPESAIEYAAACAEAGVGFVTGTTGFDADGREALETSAERVPLLWATNFSQGIHALGEALGEITETLSEYDIEMTETHHNRKRDAPSGTATTLLDGIDDASGGEHDRTYGREGDQPRADGEIGVHVRRAGGIRGEHEVLFAGNDEVLTFTHRAESRAVFASGALDAAVWLAGRDPGFYEFGEVLA
ncbi:4-hydroxy-tetrahydrodipicolinate reductase [Halococcus qingdaonensis]|uniref:4-hydroxy-tetrahydrodipicolinate reductase n=1 Tax=Halococcus qingdaonensis TaxID=224402 RepID=UPI002117140C|nr:4-hydroxy-tetrahydrodipicolinate reductase [Halococcus qingdaonensis]